MAGNSLKRKAKLLGWIVKTILGFSINFGFSLYVLRLTGVISDVTLTLGLVPAAIVILLSLAVMAVLMDIDT